MRRAVFVLLIFAACQSGIELDPRGQYRCVPERTTARSFGGCPTGLFCGVDRTCHRVDVGGDYACTADFGCGGDFRCGPLGRCVDPREDSLRTDGLDVVLLPVRSIGQKAPWTGVSAIGAGRQFFKSSAAGLTDIEPIAVAQGRDLYSVATSSLGFGSGEHFYVGKATLNEPIIDAAPIRQQVYALTAEKLYRYAWPADIDGGLQPINVGTSAQRIGERLRVGNSAFPIVAEFSLDAPAYRLHDASKPGFVDTGPVALVAPATIDDIVDTDGKYVYASFGGLLHAATRTAVLDAIANGGAPTWSPTSLVSVGRNELLTDCAAASVSDKLVIRALHVGDNPDLTQVERPLVALEVDLTHPDGGQEPRHWMRIDPDPSIGGCGFPRHVARGFCPACLPGEPLKDLQWGRTSTNQPVLRAECGAGDGGAPVFYNLSTDSTGFACIRDRRLNSGLPGAPTSRQRSSATVAAAAVDTRIYVRRDAEDPYLGLTLEQAPELVDQLPGQGLVALAGRAIFRETPNLGLALSNFAQRGEVFPAAVVQGSTWLVRDNGTVIDLADLGRASDDVTVLAAPTRTDLKPPFLGARATTPDGGSLLVMASFDALLAGGLGAADAGKGTIEVRAVPEGQVPILSLTVVPADPAVNDGGVAPLTSGYVLTRNRLFAFRAVTELQWNVQPVTLTEGDWMKVWVDQRRGRVGYRDGSVYALPSAVRVAPPISPASVVQDFVHYCGRSYALAPDGLYRLDPVPGSPVGTWTKQPELVGTGFRRMQPTRNGSLWVFTDDGRGVSLRGNPCGQ